MRWGGGRVRGRVCVCMCVRKRTPHNCILGRWVLCHFCKFDIPVCVSCASRAERVLAQHLITRHATLGGVTLAPGGGMLCTGVVLLGFA